MKNIKWHDAITSKPKINTEDRFDKENGRSVRVLVYVKNERPSFAVFVSKDDYNQWVIEGFIGNYTVTHWAYLNKPL